MDVDEQTGIAVIREAVYPANMQVLDQPVTQPTAQPVHPTTEGTLIEMDSNAEQDIIALSRQKWDWMSRRQTEPLAALFHENAVFVHMGATMTKEQELEVIDSGQIHYKDIDIQETSVRFIAGTTAILLNKISLVAVVGGNEVTNPFVVTEVYVRNADAWTLAAVSFTRLLTP